MKRSITHIHFKHSRCEIQLASTAGEGCQALLSNTALGPIPEAACTGLVAGGPPPLAGFAHRLPSENTWGLARVTRATSPRGAGSRLAPRHAPAG